MTQLRRRGRLLGLLGVLCFAVLLALHSACSLVNNFASQATAIDKGAVVVGGVVVDPDGGENFVLTALDPKTGATLPHATREMTVAGVFNDGDRPDLWFIFESGTPGQFFAQPQFPFYVHAMQLDPFDGTWTELSELQIPTAVSFSTTAVLTRSLVYLAYDGTDATSFKLVALDTSNPWAITKSAEAAVSTGDGPPIALVGARQSSGAQFVVLCEAPGALPAGATAANPAERSEFLTAYQLLQNGTFSMQAPPTPVQIQVGSGRGLVGFASVSPRNASGAPMVLVVAAQQPPADASADGPVDPDAASLGLFDPANNIPGQTGVFFFNDLDVQPPAISRCDDYAFVSGINVGTGIAPVSLDALVTGGTDLSPLLQRTARSGQGLYFEPYTHTLLAPFVVGNNVDFGAYRFSLAPDGTNPQLDKRTAIDWNPNPNLRPNFVATKSPISYCPDAGP